MWKLLPGVALALLFIAQPALAAELIVKRSPHSVSTTLDRLEKALAQKDIGVMARIDHAANAKSVEMELRPTELLIFGNPAVGTKLMQAEQTMGLELPMKALAWEDAEGQIWIGYESPAVFAERRGLSPDHEVVQAVADALDALTEAAIQH
ncbi:MAG: DUF302 domain-containing protein [Rhodovibrionaceae bacterium]